MGIVDMVSTLKYVPTLLELKKAMVPQPDDTPGSWGAWVEHNAATLADSSAILFEGKEVTWGQFNALANQYANHLKSEGIQPGDTVSVIMENRIEFLAVIIALNKLGAVGALINTNLTGRPLTHCISVTESKKCIFGSEVTEAIEEIKGELALQEGSDYYIVPDGDAELDSNWAIDFSQATASADTSNPPEAASNTIGQTSLYIFTSGTTGLPKAAVLSNRRSMNASGLSAKAGLKLKPKDRIYLCLPLYHGTGLMVGAGAAFASGASMFVRRRFSASNFLPEVRKHNCTGFVYIGELCRYLTNTEPKPDDHKNPLRAMIGNGMRPDVWMKFKQRYKIGMVAEFYGASEGNVSFANLLNKDCTVGMTASEVCLVKYDVDADEIIRDEQGFCIRAAHGEPGLMLGKITEAAQFEGYTDPEATEKKVVRDALETGDAWFNSGDLMCTVDVGYTLGYDHYQFVDRIGDTFRWKSENVSTNEIGEIINGFSEVKFCNVYGVEIPGADGRAGMAALTLNEGVTQLDLAAFAAYVKAELPSYAAPLFLRIQPDIDVTGTFKMVKGELRKQAYDITQFSDPVFVRQNGDDHYTPLDQGYVDLIKSGNAGY
ncbi:MAG: citronellyl-CoA synthetase [Limisphaerales bacterium]|jgi:citronellyl-CoA synthetase